ncbi:MAG: hypothetical protein K0R94_599 [Burkholderiales bacterium]|jgi:hypothetical protein|nr:hypothetical protein [Burkholderiales bacterium]
MSNAKLHNHNKLQGKNEFLRGALSSTPVNHYWKKDNNEHKYSDSSTLESIKNTPKNNSAYSESNTFDSAIDPQHDINYYLNEIENIIQFYNVDTVDNGLELAQEYNTLSDEIILNKRESEILYYLSLNKSIKDIAAVATILDNKEVSASEINAIVNKQLYPKFKVDNISQLVDKATALNLILFQLEN